MATQMAQISFSRAPLDITVTREGRKPLTLSPGTQMTEEISAVIDTYFGVLSRDGGGTPAELNPSFFNLLIVVAEARAAFQASRGSCRDFEITMSEKGRSSQWFLSPASSVAVRTTTDSSIRVNLPVSERSDMARLFPTWATAADTKDYLQQLQTLVGKHFGRLADADATRPTVYLRRTTNPMSAHIEVAELVATTLVNWKSRSPLITEFDSGTKATLYFWEYVVKNAAKRPPGEETLIDLAGFDNQRLWELLPSYVNNAADGLPLPRGCRLRFLLPWTGVDRALSHLNLSELTAQRLTRLGRESDITLTFRVAARPLPWTGTLIRMQGSASPVDALMHCPRLPTSVVSEIGDITRFPYESIEFHDFDSKALPYLSALQRGLLEAFNEVWDMPATLELYPTAPKPSVLKRFKEYWAWQEGLNARFAKFDPMTDGIDALAAPLQSQTPSSQPPKSKVSSTPPSSTSKQNSMRRR